MNAFEQVEALLVDSNLRIASKDFKRPWGGFFVIEEADTLKFIQKFFTDTKVDSKGKLSPKILVVAPNKRLSWQYHYRRSEIWKLIDGIAGLKRSLTDDESELQSLELNKTIQLAQGERHRLVGLNGWGIVAEIWQHTDPQYPSDENDIVRLQDDFGR